MSTGITKPDVMLTSGQVNRRASFGSKRRESQKRQVDILRGYKLILPSKWRACHFKF